MRALRQLGFLKLGFRPDGQPAEDHRVLALFRNRAVLKKAYAGLQEEIFRLKDLVKQQEGATQRVQEMLGTLEGRLGAADTAYPALVFYQLRRLWQTGRELIARLVADLARQREERERRAHLAQYNQRQFARCESAQRQLVAAEEMQAQAAARLRSLESDRARLTRLWHYFRRRALERRIAAARAVVCGADVARTVAQAAATQIAQEAAPEFPGLSLAARRAINLAAIACAEALCRRLAGLKTPLVALAHAATGRREATDDYGSPRECVLLMGQIARAHALIGAPAGLAAEIRAAGERLQRVARYRAERDSAPLADSIGSTGGDVLAGAAQGAQQAARVPNVLAEDTWDLFRILLR